MADDKMVRDIDIVIAEVQLRMPNLQVRQWHKTWPADDDGIWWFSLPGVTPDIHVESPLGMCPFVVETNEQCCDVALKANTVHEAISMIEDYLKSVDRASPVLLRGEMEWSERHG